MPTTLPTARVLSAAILAWFLAGPAFAALDPGTLIKLSTSVLAPDFANARAELERVSLRRDLPSETAAPSAPCRL